MKFILLGLFSLFGGLCAGAYFGVMDKLFSSNTWWGFPLYMKVGVPWLFGSLTTLIYGLSRCGLLP